MNIYLDIDGVLKDSASPRSDVEALVKYCLRKHPDSVYWLTTHCRGGVNATRSALEGVFNAKLSEEIWKKLKPTNWDILKTEAIDMIHPFVWLDDTVLQSEISAMEAGMPGDVSYGLFLMNKDDSMAAKDALEYLKTIDIIYNQ